MLNSVMCFERLGGVYVLTCICIDWCKRLFLEMLFLYFLNESKIKKWLKSNYFPVTDDKTSTCLSHLIALDRKEPNFYHSHCIKYL